MALVDLSKTAALEYTFLIDLNVTTFTSKYEFEKALAQFFGQHGLEATKVKMIEGQNDKGLLFISKKPTESILQPQKNPVGRPQTLKGKLKELSDRKYRKAAVEFMKGKK